MKQAIILTSGGLDSTVTAMHLKERYQSKYKQVRLLFFNYGQKALKEELFCARKLAKKMNAELKVIGLKWLGKISTSLINTNKKTGKGEVIKWYVPCRNSLFLLAALAHAESEYIKNKNKTDIFIGIKYEGELCFKDTTPKFVKKINELIGVCVQKGDYKIKAPFLNKDKEDIIELANKIKIDLENTYSCYIGKGFKKIKNKKMPVHCGKCAGCLARKKGFEFSTVEDPSIYEV
jgi:7-cyano-7-deazaguanine synthase